MAKHDSHANSKAKRKGGRSIAPVSMAHAPVHYDRARDLPRLMPLYAEEIDAGDTAALGKLVGKLQRALRAERQRGLAGHWTYDLARHLALLRAYRAEREVLAHSIVTSRAPLHWKRSAGTSTT